MITYISMSIGINFWPESCVGPDKPPLETTQYTSITYTHRLESLGMIPSTGNTGDAYDNAMAESLNAAYKRELITRFGPWKTVMDVELATMNWVHWYNTTRPHGSLGYQSPIKYKNSYQEKQKTTEQPTPALRKP